MKSILVVVIGLISFLSYSQQEVSQAQLLAMLNGGYNEAAYKNKMANEENVAQSKQITPYKSLNNKTQSKQITTVNSVNKNSQEKAIQSKSVKVSNASKIRLPECTRSINGKIVFSSNKTYTCDKGEWK